MKNKPKLILAAIIALVLLSITGCGNGAVSGNSPVNDSTAGVCGSANGGTLDSAPTGSALCAAGTASAVTGSGPWSWSCAGSNGGATASCSAFLATAAVNGACGSANGERLGSEPSGSALCAAGTASAVTGSGPWGWSCAGSNGGTTASCSTILVAGPLSSYAVEAAACAALPYGSGAIHYFCDCDGPGAQSDCVSGADSNSGTTPAAPKKTVAAARALASTLGAGDTIAFCRGGAFPAGYGSSGGWTSSGCTSANPCTIREYAPNTFTGSQPPILAFPRIANQQPPRGQYSASTTYAKDDLIVDADGLITHISLQGGNLNHEPPTQAKGYANMGTWWAQWESTLFPLLGIPNANLRILNLAVKGDGTGSVMSASNGTSDVKLCNVEADGSGIPVYIEATGTVPARISVRGNKITNSRVMGFLGAASDSELAYNDFEGNGGTNVFDHSIYVSAHDEVSHFSVVGNIVRGQYGNECNGVQIVAHGRFVNYTVDGNLIEVDPAQTTGGCWGIAADNGGYNGTYVRNGVFSRNTIRNAGNTAISVANCTNCLIENNLITSDWCYGPSCNWSIDAIVAPRQAAGSGDDVSGNITIRNNTIWFGPATVGGASGIKIGVEGTGYTVENNLMVFSPSQAAEGVRCFDYSLSLSAYSAINHNACYSAYTNTEWENTRGSLTAWRTASGFDADSFTSDPLLTIPGTDFTPGPTSPLVGAADPAHAPTTDLTGKTRDAQPDIGAVER